MYSIIKIMFFHWNSLIPSKYKTRLFNVISNLYDIQQEHTTNNIQIKININQNKMWQESNNNNSNNKIYLLILGVAEDFFPWCISEHLLLREFHEDLLEEPAQQPVHTAPATTEQMARNCWNERKYRTIYFC